MPKKSPLSFEKTLSDLEKIITKMEANTLSLEEALKEFERGVQLTKDCQQFLEQAEQTIKIVQQNELKPYSNDDNT